MRKWIDLFEHTNLDRAWHGSPSALTITKLRASNGGELGPGLYFSRDFQTASGYAAPRGEDAWSPNSGVIELDLSGLNIAAIVRQDWLDRRAVIMDQLRADNNGEWKAELYDQAMDQLIHEYESQGYDGLYDDWRQGVVFPNRISGVHIVGTSPTR